MDRGCLVYTNSLVYPHSHSTTAEGLLSRPLCEVLAKRFIVLLCAESHTANYPGVPLQNVNFVWSAVALCLFFCRVLQIIQEFSFCIIVYIFQFYPISYKKGIFIKFSVLNLSLYREEKCSDWAILEDIFCTVYHKLLFYLFVYPSLFPTLFRCSSLLLSPSVLCLNKRLLFRDILPFNNSLNYYFTNSL